MVIDRIEGDTAVIELSGRAFIDVPLDRIDGNVRDGAVLTEVDGRYLVDEAATSERVRRTSKKRHALFNKR